MRPDQVFKTLDSGGVSRFHTRRCIHPQGVDAHSWQVAALCMMITRGRASAGLLWAALTHDVGEIATGDVPGPVKRANPEVERIFNSLELDHIVSLELPAPLLLPGESTVLHAADSLSGAYYCLVERRMGNRVLEGSFGRYIKALRGLNQNDAHSHFINELTSYLENEYDNLRK